MEPTRNKQFADRQELKAAIDLWIRDDCATNPDCRVSLRYGWPMNVWQVELVTDMSTLFRDQSFFNEKISDWEVSQVTNMNGMFEDAEEFNSDISTWNVTNVSRELSLLLVVQLDVYTLTSPLLPLQVTDMGFMFAGAKSFNSDLSKWDVSSVKDMPNTFWKASAVSTIQLFKVCVFTLYILTRSLLSCTPQFNSDISRWKVQNVKSFNQMFREAVVFNTDLSRWDVSNAETLDYFFLGAAAFNQDLCRWRANFPYVEATYQLMFGGTSCSEQGDPLFLTRGPFCFECDPF